MAIIKPMYPTSKVIITWTIFIYTPIHHHHRDDFEVNPKYHSISSLNISYASWENEDCFKKHNYNIIATLK